MTTNQITQQDLAPEDLATLQQYAFYKAVEKKATESLANMKLEVLGILNNRKSLLIEVPDTVEYENIQPVLGSFAEFKVSDRTSYDFGGCPEVMELKGRIKAVEADAKANLEPKVTTIVSCSLK